MNKGIYSFCTGMVDFPNRYALTVYFNGCNLNCDFCHNKHILLENGTYSLNDIVKEYYDLKEIIPSCGIVFSGGEPTCNELFYDALAIFSKEPTSLHTNGLINIPEYQGNIILGLKPFEENSYIKQINNYLEIHKYADYKEIRYIKNINNIEYNNVLSKIKTNADKYCWNIIGVNDSRPLT
jgi:organic radical activating enzyme